MQLCHVSCPFPSLCTSSTVLISLPRFVVTVVSRIQIYELHKSTVLRVLTDVQTASKRCLELISVFDNLTSPTFIMNCDYKTEMLNCEAKRIAGAGENDLNNSRNLKSSYFTIKTLSKSKSFVYDLKEMFCEKSWKTIENGITEIKEMKNEQQSGGKIKCMKKRVAIKTHCDEEKFVNVHFSLIEWSKGEMVLTEIMPFNEPKADEMFDFNKLVDSNKMALELLENDMERVSQIIVAGEKEEREENREVRNLTSSIYQIFSGYISAVWVSRSSISSFLRLVSEKQFYLENKPTSREFVLRRLNKLKKEISIHNTTHNNEINLCFEK